MVKIILGVVAGFVTWSILWLGGEALLTQLSPTWYGKYSEGVQAAFAQSTTLEVDPLISIINLIRSFFTSIVAGYICALVAGEYRRSTMILGVILLATGIVVQYFGWNLAPVWYHILFLLMLIPMTILGGRLRRSA